MVTYTDAFTRADTTSGLGVIPGGPAWSILTGNWSITSQKPVTPDANNTNPFVVADFLTPDLDLSVISGYGGDAVYFRVVDANNWLRARRRSYSTTSSSQEPIYDTRTVYVYATEYEYADVDTYYEYGWTCYYENAWGNHSAPYTIGRTGSSYPTGSGNCPTSITHEHSVWHENQQYWGIERHSHMFSHFGNVDTTQVSTINGYYWDTSARGGGDYRTGDTRQVIVDSYQETYISGYNTVYDTDYHYQVYLEECVDGVITTIASSSCTSATTPLRVVATGTSIQVYVSTTLEIDTTRTTHQNATKHGFGRGDSSRNSQQLDDFSITIPNRAPNAPPAVTAPAANAMWDTSHTIVWTAASDPDQDPLTYDVELSTDGGATWTTVLGTAVSGTSLIYDFSAIPETSQAKIRVRSSDGSLTSAWVESGTFAIDHRTVLVRVGTNLPADMYLGPTKVDRVYAGSVLVFGKEPE